MAKDLPPISIVTPSYNQAEFLEETILSVLNQEYPNLEYVVIDGGSTDGSVDIIRKYDARLAHWVSERDKGQSHAVNKGILASTGQIIGWLNSDDIYYPNAVHEVLSVFLEHPSVDVVYGDADHIDEDGAVIGPYPTEEWDYERLKDFCYLCQPAVFFRRRLVRAFGLLEESLDYCMDYEYWLRLGDQVEFRYLKRRLAGSRLYGENKTLGRRLQVHREIVDMTQKCLGRTPERWIYNYAAALVDRKGFDRTKPSENLMYVLNLAGMSALAFMRWYHHVPPDAVRTFLSWLRPALVRALRE